MMSEVKRLIMIRDDLLSASALLDCICPDPDSTDISDDDWKTIQSAAKDADAAYREIEGLLKRNGVDHLDHETVIAATTDSGVNKDELPF